MANEIYIKGYTTPFSLYYGVARRSSDHAIWNTHAPGTFETVDIGHWGTANYTLAISENPVGSLEFFGSIPGGVGGVPEGYIYYEVYQSVSASVYAPTDARIMQSNAFYWNGSAILTTLPTSDSQGRVTGINDAGQVWINGSVNDTGPTATVFKGVSTLSATDNFYNGQWLVFNTGILQGALPQKIVGYIGATRQFTLFGGFPTAPTNGDSFIIIGHAP